MSKIYNNGITTTAGFQFNADLPLDDRLVVKEYSDLASLTHYEGMIVYVTDDLKHYTYSNNSWELLRDTNFAAVAKSGQFEDLLIGDDIVLILDGGGADTQLAILDKTILL